LFAVLLLLSPVAGQMCSGYTTCDSCLGVSGCVWDAAPTPPVCQSLVVRGSPCNGPWCVDAEGKCPALGIYGSTTTSLTTYPSLYKPTVATAYPSASLYTPAASVYASAPVYSSASFAASAPVYSSASFAAPVYSPSIYSSPVYGSASFSSPASASSTYFGGGPWYSGGQYYGGGYGGGGGGGGYGGGSNGLFNFNGGVTADIQNSIYANALNGGFPGISSTVNSLNDYSLLSNGGIGNIVSGRGYNNNPLGTYVKNQYVAGQLNNLIPGIGSNLNTFNNYNLLSSLIR